MTFQDLPLQPAILKAVAEAGYTSPSPIQAGAIPPYWPGATFWAVRRQAPAKLPPLRCPFCRIFLRKHPSAPVFAL